MSSESRIWEIRPFGSMRGGRALVIGLWASQSILFRLLYGTEKSSPLSLFAPVQFPPLSDLNQSTSRVSTEFNPLRKDCIGPVLRRCESRTVWPIAIGQARCDFLPVNRKPQEQKS